MVTEEVYLKTSAKQLPWTNSSLRRVLSFDTAADDSGDADQSAIKSERRKLLLSIASTPAPTQKYVEQLAGQEKVPLDALYGMRNSAVVRRRSAPSKPASAKADTEAASCSSGTSISRTGR